MNYAPWPGVGFEPVDWAKFFAAAGQSAKSTKAVERRRATGTDFSTFLGVSIKADKRLKRAPSMMRGQIGVKGPKPGFGMDASSKTGRIRAMLATGPKSSGELAKGISSDVQAVIGLMRNEVRQGRIVKIGAARPLLYALGEVA